MRTIRLLISFDGTDYRGWQRQDCGPTIQAEIERAATLICNSTTTVHGAGRTDAGVHALGMTAHFLTTSTIKSIPLLKGLNALLPEDIRIIDVTEEPAAFHARFSASAKTYRYAVFNGPIECPLKRRYRIHYPYALATDTIRCCLETIIGTHDFSSFEATGTRDKKQETGRGAVRTLFSAELKQPEPDLFHFILTGDGFLRHMVRNIVGTLLDVGRGKRSIEDFKLLLTQRDRNRAGATAPARGLTLLAVHYDDDKEAA
ncbi:MAG: tRNA pseudouridine(38-40) synthase TruA [Desulfofustis sp.]|nr:tRNA pseudouridine(38-40) synthase TruA [Desulfofustis sp.]